MRMTGKYDDIYQRDTVMQISFSRDLKTTHIRKAVWL